MLIFAQSMRTIENFMQSLDNKYDFTDEGDIKSYLGIDISKPQEGSYKLSQPPLTKIIIQALGDIMLNTCKELAQPNVNFQRN
jgi:hypothetical protein